ncbi:MAG: hypothetical protein II874_00200 [Bacteroidales bacterium]|nr:hypothetical protein [Bacteroidales bacterium]
METKKRKRKSPRRKHIVIRLFHVLMKGIGVLLLLLVMGVFATELSPIYRFREPRPFSGPDIFNPYRNLDPAAGWKRANFHTHTRVKGPFPPNECEEWPDATYDAYEKLGYDIVTFSNHNEITTHPFDPALQVNVYEQGYSPFKFHKLVFGSEKVKHFDPLFPFLASQKQFELDYLGDGSDFIQINHPYRTIGTSEKHMQELSGYEIMELDTSISTENEYWDWALSAGHYSFGLANDDLHHARSHQHIGIRCNFIQTPSGRYEDLKEALLGGCYYAMRVPDYGDGDWSVKYEKNRYLPSIRDIGLDGSTLYMTLSEPADSIKVTGQGHTTLSKVEHCDTIAYTMRPEDPYARLTAYFPEGEVIYSNPFARYDASVSDSPFNNAPQKVSILLTVLYNLLVLALIAGVFRLLCKLFKKR